jgi:hypothetical protein
MLDNKETHGCGWMLIERLSQKKQSNGMEGIRKVTGLKK